MTEELQRILWPKGHRQDIWAIVDAAQDQQVYWTLTNSFLPHSCLFAGALPQALEMAAPYLVRLDPDDKFTAYLAKNLGRNVGVFLQCDSSLEELRHHLRKFLTVKDTSGRKMLFRYYDPRVLRVYLPTCRSMELETVFGPITSYWTVSDDPNTLTQFEYHGKDLQVSPQPLRLPAKAESETMAAAVVPAQDVLVIQKGPGARQRVPILLQGAGQGGKLRRSSNGVKFYRTVSATDELPHTERGYTIPSVQLDPDATVYAEAAVAGEVKLTLELAKGGTAEFSVLAVELGLETGGDEVVAGVGGVSAGKRRRITVQPVAPKSFRGRLSLRSTGSGPALSLFVNETGAEGYPLSDGFSFDAPREPVNFWLEGSAPSKAPGDATLQLTLEGGQTPGDSRPVTVVSLNSIGVEIAGEEITADPVILLNGAGALGLRAEVKPEGTAVHWVIARHADDAESVRAVSPKDLPTLEGEGNHTTLRTDAAGGFTLVAGAGASEGWGGPEVTREIVLIHAALAENNCNVNGRFCACARVPGTDEFKLHSGSNPAVQLEASVALTGGGPDGQRGVEAIRGGWINNILSDNAGARYKGGTVRGGDQHAEEDGPLLEAGESRFMSGSVSSPDSAAGEPLIVRAESSPETAWKVDDGGPIEQIWRYLACRAYLALWSTQAPEQLGVLMETGWSFTGDYGCTPVKTTRTTLPARLVATRTVTHAALLPAEETRAAVHPRVAGDESNGASA